MVWQRIRNHPGLAALLVLLLVLPAPLVWLGSSTDLLEPVLYSAVIEADVVFDAECNMVWRQIVSESGRQDHVAKLEVLAFEGMFHSVAHAMDMWTHLTNKGWTPAEIEAFAQDLDVSSCGDHAGKFTTRAKLGSIWLNLMTFSSESWEIEYEKVQG
jgi:hypothetical protein